jgi:hypothetical protein
LLSNAGSGLEDGSLDRCVIGAEERLEQSGKLVEAEGAFWNLLKQIHGMLGREGRSAAGYRAYLAGVGGQFVGGAGSHGWGEEAIVGGTHAHWLYSKLEIPFARE